MRKGQFPDWSVHPQHYLLLHAREVLAGCRDVVKRTLRVDTCIASRWHMILRVGEISDERFMVNQQLKRVTKPKV